MRIPRHLHTPHACLSRRLAAEMLGITQRQFVERFVRTGRIRPLSTGAFLVHEI